MFDMCSLSSLAGRTLSGWEKGRWRQIGTVTKVTDNLVTVQRIPYKGKDQGSYTETVADMRQWINSGMLKARKARSLT